MDHDIRCIFDDIDPNDNDALSLFLNDLEDEPVTGDTAPEVDDIHSLLNDDNDKSETFMSPTGGAFRSPQPPPPAPTPNVPQPGARTTPIQQNMVMSPRTSQQPTTPGSVADSPYSQHHPATPSPASRQLTTPSPMDSPVPNSFQQPQKQLEIKLPSSNGVPLQNSLSKTQVQASNVIPDHQVQMLNQQHLLKTQHVTSASLSQPAACTIASLQTNAGGAPVQIQLQGTAANGQNLQTVQAQQVQGTVIHTSIGNQVIFQGGLSGQVQLHPQVGLNQPSQLVTSQGSIIQTTQPVTISASNIQPPTLQAPPNISIVNLQNQVQQQHQQQILLQRGPGSNNQHNVILTTLPPSSVMQLAPTTTTTQQNAIPTGMVLSQGQAQVLLTKGGQKVQGQVLLQSQPVSNSQLQIAGLKPAVMGSNTLTVQNQQGQIINIQQPAQQGTIMQNVGQRVEVNQVGTTMQNVGQQRHLLQINGQTLALTTQQLQQLINLQQKKQLVQQTSVPQHHQEPRLQQDQSQVQILQHPGTGLQVITTSGSSSTGIIAKSVSSTNSQPTLATQAAVQQNLQEIHDKMLKQSSQQQMVINDLNAVSRNSAVGSLQNIPGVTVSSSQGLGNTATPVAALTQAGTLTVLGAAGQPQANRVNVVGQGQLLTQAVVQHPPQAGVIQLQPTPGQAAVVSKSGLVAVQAITVQNVNQQQMVQNKQQVTQFRQILPSTSQVMSTVICTQPATTLTNSVSNFTNLLPSATSKPNVVAPNVNIQTLGLGNQVNSLVLQQQLQQQQKERQLQQQQQQKASLRLLPGQPPNSTNLVPGQINASLALQQLNVAQQQRNATIPQEGNVMSEQQQVSVNDLPQAINTGVASQKVVVTSTSLSGNHLGGAVCTLSTQSTQVTSPLISTVSRKAQGISSTIEVKSVGAQHGIGSNLLNTSASSGGIVHVAHSTPVLLSTAPGVPNITTKSQSGPTVSIQKPVINNVTLASAPSGQGHPGVSRVPTIQLTPQLQQALATVHQKTRALLAIPNRTEAQNASLQQLMVWQQKILLIGRTQALKSQQSQQATGVTQTTVPAAVLQPSVQQTSQQPQLIIQKPSGVSQQVTAISSAAAIPVQVQELLTSAASAGTNLVTTFATTTVVSQAAPNVPAGDGKSNSGVSHETKVITNINQLPPEMKEKLRLQLAKLTPAQLDYFLKNQAYVLTRLIKQQQEMQKLRQEQMQHPSTTPNVVKVAADQKQILQQIGSGGITIVAASEAPIASSIHGSTVTAAVASTGHTPTSTGVVTVKVPVKMSRKQLFSHYIAKDQKNVEQPDYRQPFQNHKDILKRLLAYHVCQVKEDKRKHIEEGAAAYEETAQELLAKKDEMYKKYQQLILEESMRQDRTAEMVMLERMFLASEKEVLAEEKKQAEQDPEHFVPVPCLSSDEEDSSEEHQVSNSLVPSPVTPPPADISIDSVNTSNLKHSSDCITDEQTSPGGNYTLRASTGLRLVFKTSPLHTSVSSPAPLTENFSVKSEDSGISSQQNSVETDEDGVPPKKKICFSVSEDKEHYRTSNSIKPNISGKSFENGMPKEEPNLVFEACKDKPAKHDTSGEVNVYDQDNAQKQSGDHFNQSVTGLEGLGANEADTAVAGLLSSSNMLSQDLGVCSDDLFSELTLEQHLNQGLPSDFMAESAKEDKSELHQEYYSEISDYDTDTNAGGKEQDMELQDALGGLLSDVDSDEKLHDKNGKFGEDNVEPDDVKCTDETRSAIDSLLALESPSSFNYL